MNAVLLSGHCHAGTRSIAGACGALFLAALIGGLASGIGLDATMVAFQDGLAGGAKIALSYALLGAFAMSVAHSGLPQLLADWFINKIENNDLDAAKEAKLVAKWGMLGGILAMAIMSQNLIPVHIAFIPLLIPPLLIVMSKLQIDRRAVACVITFGLVTTYMYIPMGFGRVFLYGILYANIEKSGLDVSNVPVMGAMGIPALGMLVGLLIAVFVTYRKPRTYLVTEVTDSKAPKEIHKYRIVVAVAAIIACVLLQTILTLSESATRSAAYWISYRPCHFCGVRRGEVEGCGCCLLGWYAYDGHDRPHHDHSPRLCRGDDRNRPDRKPRHQLNGNVRPVQKQSPRSLCWP